MFIIISPVAYPTHSGIGPWRKTSEHFQDFRYCLQSMGHRTRQGREALCTSGVSTANQPTRATPDARHSLEHSLCAHALIGR